KYHDDPVKDVSLRVITDHVRSTTFIISDGVMPANEGRGYVLKRLLRRAARHGRLLGINEPFIYKVVDTVIEENRVAYPELAEHADYIKKVILSEEERFCRTIDQGFELLNDYVAKLEEAGETVLPGDVAFKLYDTYGFPLDLTQDILEDKNITVDVEGFTVLMNDQKKRARDARASANGVSWVEDSLASLGDVKTKFVGYNRMDSASEVLAILKDGELVSELEEGDEAVIILDSTPFYAEMGGQVGDRGTITSGPSIFNVTDCKKSPTGQTMHIGVMGSGHIKTGSSVRARLTESIRNATQRNHTACHLLQKALREVLGDHVHQAGSYVDENRCRFDFSHFSAMTAEEIAETEKVVNEMVLASLDVDINEMPIEDAKQMGAMALFGEKYGDTVRVVNVSGRSIEFCGGTHVTNTSKIGLFKIISESSVAAGVRRIEAVTGTGVLDYIEQMNGTLSETASNLKVNGVGEVAQKSAAVMADLKAKDKEIEELNNKLAQMRVESLVANAKEICGLKFICTKFEGISPASLRIMGDHIKFTAQDAIALLASVNDDKVSVLVVCGINALKEGAHAGKIVKEIAAMAGGSGGGRPDSAMGGANPEMIDEALASAAEIVETLLINK
ncbi:MAG: alanine--tRNA ligase, partial [Oscillospiraceae bacterium]|nr:alanine--tRNA ligase [Oscillospiraceae bacterium]